MCEIKLTDCIISCEFYNSMESLDERNKENFYEIEVYRYSPICNNNSLSGIQIILNGKHKRDPIPVNDEDDDHYTGSASTPELADIFL